VANQPLVELAQPGVGGLADGAPVEPERKAPPLGEPRQSAHGFDGFAVHLAMCEEHAHVRNMWISERSLAGPSHKNDPVPERTLRRVRARKIVVRRCCVHPEVKDASLIHLNSRAAVRLKLRFQAVAIGAVERDAKARWQRRHESRHHFVPAVRYE